LKKYSDKFEILFESATINENNGATDCIFPFYREFVTNHIVIRGMFERMTLCIYGQPVSGTEGHILYEAAKTDVPLDKLNTAEDDYQQTDKLNLTNDDVELFNNYPIDHLIAPYIKCEILGGLKKAYLINPPNMNMVEKTKTGYIYYENDLNYYVQSLYNFYLNENKSNKPSTRYGSNDDLGTIDFQTYFKKICDILKILLNNNKVFLEDDCVFNNENYEIFHKIPDTVIDIVLHSLSGKLYNFSEIKSGLKLLRVITNSGVLVLKFIEKGGFELLYTLLLNRDSSLIIKVLVLENIYRLITHHRAFSYFMENMDKNKFPQQYFMIKESTKDLDISDDKKPKKKSKKKSKRKNSESRSRSRSRSRSDSVSSDIGERRKKKKQAKNILLKNGYQIILTMIVGKRNHVVVNLIKRIVNKVALQMYLREFSSFLEKMVSFV
jgi:hypothetical protein